MLALVPGSCNALAAPGMEWYGLFGANGTSLEGKDVLATPDGGYVLGGHRYTYPETK